MQKTNISMNPKSPKEILLNLAAALTDRAKRLDDCRINTDNVEDETRYRTRADTLDDIASVFRQQAHSNTQ